MTHADRERKATSTTRVVIIGGGITGLAAAWEVTQFAKSHPEQQFEIAIVEASAAFGGKVIAKPFDGRMLDAGPDAFVAAGASMRTLCEELGIDDELVGPTAEQPWLWHHAKLRKFPQRTLLGAPSSITALVRSRALSLRGILRAGLDVILPTYVGRVGSDPTIGRIVRTRLGDEVADVLVDPLLGGIYAGSIDDLSASAAMPQLAQLLRGSRSIVLQARRQRQEGKRREHASRLGSQQAKVQGKRAVFATPRDGMSRIGEVLCDQLVERGVVLHASSRVIALGAGKQGREWQLVVRQPDQSISVGTDIVVLACPAADSARLLREVSPDAAAICADFVTSSVGIVRLKYHKDAIQHACDGTGFVVPVNERRFVTSCTWLTSKWGHLRENHLQENKDEVLLRASVGRRYDERFLSMNDEEIISDVHAELSEAMGIREAPLEADVTRWRNAFVQYESGHLARVGAIREKLQMLSGLAVAGASFDGIGVSACVQSGRREAAVLAAAHAAGRAEPEDSSPAPTTVIDLRATAPQPSS